MLPFTFARPEDFYFENVSLSRLGAPRGAQATYDDVRTVTIERVSESPFDGGSSRAETSLEGSPLS